ncbi:MAG TPA: class I SAM-dependent methyltransferase [Polyangiaceae bacterium]|jgi:SAM-dependent methyltransferase|nr:class I SAM-dependent methyltransferase [Polyangiaceae bacterium]
MPRAKPSSARLGAELYALTHRGNAGDIEFYGELARGADRVLELGCGYGRLIPRLARAANRVVGLDLDPELLRLARRRGLNPKIKTRNVQLIRGDVRNFACAARFQRVFIPYNGFYCLLTQRDALACLRAVRAALDRGGLLAFDVWNAAEFHRRREHTGADAGDVAIVSLRHARRVWHVFERTRVRRAAQRLDVTYEYVPADGGDSHRIEIPQRYYLLPELEQLLRRAGFTLEKRFGDFDLARYTPRSDFLILVARAR